ncbi:MAG TPA: cytochrome c3 family protein [Gemmatimonadota bacterium]|nr:cytochrome c3 family protein [Gemmatimonadota bacterium]
MRERATVRAWLLALPLVLVMGLAGCDDDCPACQDPGIVPPVGGEGYLGYTNLVEAEGFTTCGLCHATFQAGWEGTGHAHAWEGLQSSDHAQSFCEGCHTVNQLGNPDTEDVGWLATGDSVFLDVQCVSCHGGGATHAAGPTMANAPLCSIVADTAATTGCGECHSGEHHPFVEQWRESRHGTLNSYPAGREGCNACHEGRVALEVKFYETSNYVEKSYVDSLYPIVCVVCHDVHGSEYPANLRAPVAEASFDHLCIRCHARHAVPPSTRGTHAGQGFLVLADDVGWIPPGFTDPGIHAHGSVLNEGVCITCHVNGFEVTDTAGEFVFQSVGHNFEAIPCLDAEGLPTAGPCDDADRQWAACLECHTTEAEVIDDYNALKDSINVLLDILWVDSNANDTIDVADAGMLPVIVANYPPEELDPSDALVTVAEGALFNGQVAYTDDRPIWGGYSYVNGVRFSSHKMSGNGVHNPDFLIELLLATIAHMQDWYPELGIP